MALLLAGLVFATEARATIVNGFSDAISPANIRVWLEADDGSCGEDVYAAVENVVVSVRTSRSCYATVYLVDTAGYIHIIYPLSPYDNTYFRGGSVYRFYLSDFRFDQGFGRGVAYAFAVTSPIRFAYGDYGWDVFGARFGYQVCGDPYVAARSFYLSVIPGSCRAETLGIGHARFFVKEYVRYPSYLCAGWHESQGAGGYCRADCGVYKQYTAHATDPYRVLNPVRQVSEGVRERTQIIRTEKQAGGARVRPAKTAMGAASGPTAYEGGGRRTDEGVDDGTRRPRIVSTKNTFVQGKKDIISMRRQLERSNVETRRTAVRSSGESGKQLEARIVVARQADKNVLKTDAGTKKVSKKTQQVARVTDSSANTKTSADGRTESTEKKGHGSR